LLPADGNPSPFLNTNVHTNLDPDTDVDADAHRILGHAGLHA
jgi:hypothetical protein